MSYWHIDVTYYRGDGTHGSVGLSESAYEIALTAAFREASYYLLECGYPRTDAAIKELCSDCHGEGVIHHKRPRSVQIRKCKTCKGHKGALSSVGPFPVYLHPNATHRAEALS